MTLYFSYIGDLDDPDFDWDDPPRAPAAGNLPRRIVPSERHASIGIDLRLVKEQVEQGIGDGKRLDWGAWGLRKTGRELVELFGPDHAHAVAIAALDPDRHYVLVAGEQ